MTQHRSTPMGVRPAGYYTVTKDGRSLVARWLPSKQLFVTPRNGSFEEHHFDSIGSKVA